MKQAFEKISHRALTAFSALFSQAVSRQADQVTLSRHILALNNKDTSTEIINEMALCLKELFDYRLFAFVVRQKEGVDVWLDPRMYKKSMEEIICQDFDIRSADNINYLNHNFATDEAYPDFEMDDLIFYEMDEANCRARLYMMPRSAAHPFQDETIALLLQACATALSKQLEIETLKDAAVVDPLTGAYNRREFENQIRRHVASATRHKSKLSVFMFDLDHFKKVNDTYGHLGGDQVLKEVAALVSRNMRKGDILARYGGEEFIAILPETDKAKAMELADRLREKIAALPVRHHGKVIKVTASFGVSELVPNADIAHLIEEADTMLYKAKVNGRNTVMPGLIKIFSPKIPQPMKPKADVLGWSTP
ncbi:MAG: GGDEF domain-containing protein [Desulfobacterales bacterium]|nr:GGDEF domain-containing protein [Desulfobacterales bacterium]